MHIIVTNESTDVVQKGKKTFIELKLSIHQSNIYARRRILTMRCSKRMFKPFDKHRMSLFN